MAVSAERIAVRGGRRTSAPLDGSPRAPDAVAVSPCRAGGLELLGTFEQSGHKRSPCLVRRVDGQMVQLSRLLYEVLNTLDGKRTYDEIAEVVSSRGGQLVTGADVGFLVENKLQPLGLLRGDDGAEPITKKMNPLLALRFRFVVTNPNITGRIAAVFAPLFKAPAVAIFSVTFLAITAWLLFDHGLAAGARQALYEPHMLLVVFALTTLSAGFHELGHAAACRYSGAKPGAMGVGLYLVWPAFYTDVTDAYRLDRKGRLRTDVGGLYFNAIFAVITFGIWLATRSPALLIVIPLQGLQMVRQLIPLVRLDGYHILADITGVPDLFAHIKPILTSLLPTRWGKGEARGLKPWVRVVVTAWVLVVVPLLLFILGTIVVALPRILATAWDSVSLSWTEARGELAAGRLAGAAVSALGIAALAIPAASMVYVVARVLRRTTRRVWDATDGHPLRRIGALAVGVALVLAVLGAWWPRGQYTPIQPHETGALFALGNAAELEAPEISLTESNTQLTSLSLPVTTATGETGPVEFQLISPESVEAAVAAMAGMAVDERATFPFPLPPPPGFGDNQALVVNTLDGSSMIDVALSLVFMEADTVANRNEAFALASCARCTTVAIAFQLVIIVDQSRVVIPENVAAAVNAECIRCVTHAIATQLIGSSVTEDQLVQIRALWKKLQALDRKAARMSLAKVYAELDEIQIELETVLFSETAPGLISEDAAGVTTGETPGATGLVGDTPLPSTSPSASGAGEPAAQPSGSPSPQPSSSPSTDPEPSPSQSSEPEPTANPSSSSSP